MRTLAMGLGFVVIFILALLLGAAPYSPLAANLFLGIMGASVVIFVAAVSISQVRTTTYRVRRR